MQVFITHCAAAVNATATAIFFIMAKTPGKSTFPFSRIRSTASPVRMGTYRVSTTVTAARISDNPTRSQYLLI